MPRVRRLHLIRHGETQGESSIRYHGITDTPLSAPGRLQMQRVHALLRDQKIDRWIASPLRRSWLGARIASGGRWVQIAERFREVDFGRWEGLTSEEIEARDPELFARWRSGVLAAGFDYPDGEAAAAFDARIAAATEWVLASPSPALALVLHKGVIRRFLHRIGLEEELDRSRPELGEVVLVVREPGGWVRI